MAIQPLVEEPMPHATPCIAFPTKFSDGSRRFNIHDMSQMVNIIGLHVIMVILRGNRLACASVSDSSRPTCVDADACGA